METETLEDLRAAFADNPKMLAWLDEAEQGDAAEAAPAPDSYAMYRVAKARMLARVVIYHEMRCLVNYVKLWDSCGVTACRKARACRGRRVACFDRLSETIVDRLEATLEWWRLTEGPPDIEALDYEVARLRRLGAPL